MVVNFKEIIDKFRGNKLFQNESLDIFEKLFIKNKVLCLTYNNVLGRLWREVCKMRNNEKVLSLQKKLSSLPKELEGDDGNQLQKWIKDSYDALDDILTLISKVPNHLPALIIVSETKEMERNDILEITRSCNISSFQKILEMFSIIKIQTSGNLPERYLPLSLKPKQIFGLLPHLLCSGTLFSLRPSLICAAIAYLSGNEILVDLAKKFIINFKGQWIKMDDPLNFSIGFIKLLLKVPFALTEDEIKFFTKINHLVNLREKLNKTFVVSIGFTPVRGQTYYDIKEKCITCKRTRSLTLLNSDGICGLCIAVPKENWPEPGTLGGACKSYLISCNECKGLSELILMI